MCQTISRFMPQRTLTADLAVLKTVCESRSVKYGRNIRSPHYNTLLSFDQLLSSELTRQNRNFFGSGFTRSRKGLYAWRTETAAHEDFQWWGGNHREEPYGWSVYKAIVPAGARYYLSKDGKAIIATQLIILDQQVF